MARHPKPLSQRTILAATAALAVLGQEWSTGVGIPVSYEVEKTFKSLAAAIGKGGCKESSMGHLVARQTYLDDGDKTIYYYVDLS